MCMYMYMCVGIYKYMHAFIHVCISAWFHVYVPRHMYIYNCKPVCVFEGSVCGGGTHTSFYMCVYMWIGGAHVCALYCPCFALHCG